MLTLFTTAKPFRGHCAVTQRNALQSWRLLHPSVEILLFGDEEGYAGAARDFGLRHVPDVLKNEFGTILVSAMFERAQALARNDLLCYVNCDIVLLPDFLAALEAARSRLPRFLMLGRRWDLDIAVLLPFANPGWHSELRERALRHGRRRAPHWIDYFAFSRGTFGAIPGFAIGRTCWDNWLVWSAAASGCPVIDASPAVVAVHQNHDYSHHPGGHAGAWFGREAARNRQLAGSLQHFFTIAHATHRLTMRNHPGDGLPQGTATTVPKVVDNLELLTPELRGRQAHAIHEIPSSILERKRFYRLTWAWWRVKRTALDLSVRARGAWQNALWHPFLNATRPFRSALGLRKRLNMGEVRKS